MKKRIFSASMILSLIVLVTILSVFSLDARSESGEPCLKTVSGNTFQNQQTGEWETHCFVEGNTVCFVPCDWGPPEE